MTSSRVRPVTRTEVARLARQVHQQVPQLRDLLLMLGNSGQLCLATLRIHHNERGQGYGSQVLTLITDWADQRGLNVTVTPEPAHLDGETIVTEKRRLRQFYTRHGFRRNCHYPEYSEKMVREPRPQA